MSREWLAGGGLMAAGVIAVVAGLAACSTPAPGHRAGVPTEGGLPSPSGPFPGVINDVTGLINGVSTGPGGGAWAVGSIGPAPGRSGIAAQTLILRWTGTGWSRVPSPSPGSSPQLFGVSAGPGGTWAAGDTCVARCGTASETDQALILRWTGMAWSRVPSPVLGSRSILRGVSAGRGGVWAVGDTCIARCGTASEIDRALIAHWDGAGWSRAATPGLGRSAALYGVSAGPGGTWAVGDACVARCSTGRATDQALILRWTGTAWSRIAGPSPGLDSLLSSVSTGPDGGAWAVGYTCTARCGTGLESDHTLILRWAGAGWSRVPSPSPGGSPVLYGVSAGPDGTAWAAGDACAARCAGPLAFDQTVILRWTGAAWSAG